MLLEVTFSFNPINYIQHQNRKLDELVNIHCIATALLGQVALPPYNEIAFKLVEQLLNESIFVFYMHLNSNDTRWLC